MLDLADLPNLSVTNPEHLLDSVELDLMILENPNLIIWKHIARQNVLLKQRGIDPKLYDHRKDEYRQGSASSTAQRGDSSLMFWLGSGFGCPFILELDPNICMRLAMSRNDGEGYRVCREVRYINREE